MVAFRVVVYLTVIVVAAATDVHQCPEKPIENLSENVNLSPCKKVPCALKKGSNQSITIKFIADKDTPDIKNRVTAEVFGVPLPFIGVDGYSICDKISLENGDKATCPLKAGTKYIYQDSFPVLDVYPTINVKVHWELEDEKKQKVVCFEVPARIKPKSKQH